MLGLAASDHCSGSPCLRSIPALTPRCPPALFLPAGGAAPAAGSGGAARSPAKDGSSGQGSSSGSAAAGAAPPASPAGGQQRATSSSNAPTVIDLTADTPPPSRDQRAQRPRIVPQEHWEALDEQGQQFMCRWLSKLAL